MLAILAPGHGSQAPGMFTPWLEVEGAKGTYPLEGESPLQAFVKKHDLTWRANMGTRAGAR